MRLIPSSKDAVDKLVLDGLALDVLVQAVADHLLVPRPRRDLADEPSECRAIDSDLGLVVFLLDIVYRRDRLD